MKILRITALGYETGGVESGIVLMQPILETRGHTVKTLASGERPDLPHFNEFSYKPFSTFEKIFYNFNPYSYRALKRALREFQPDIVHIHTMGEASPSILFALKGYPAVLTVHGPEIFSKSLRLWCFPLSSFKHGIREVHDLTLIGKMRYLYHRYLYDPLFARGMRNVGAVITLSDYMHRLMAEEGLENIYIQNATVLFEHHSLTRDAVDGTLVYVGRLETTKGVDYLLRAMPTVIERFPYARLFIAGDGGADAELKALARSLGLTHQVTFLGHLDRAKLEELYRRSTLVVMPSAYPEAFGKVGIEAMSVGRPVIATDVGGVRDWLVHGETGILVPQMDAAALSDALTSILADPDRIVQMGQNARARSGAFDLTAHVERTEQVYKDVINAHKTQERL